MSCIILATTLLWPEGCSQRANETERAKDKVMFADNQYMSKGGIGIISKDLYIVLKSKKNELFFTAGERWTGREVTSPEVVVVFEGRFWLAQELPNKFDLSKSIVVSFEGDKVRFFDFDRMSGGYYRRLQGD